MDSSEGYVNVPGGKVWYRRIGSGGPPLLCLHGGPGFTHHYLEALEQFADDREVVFYDQLGCGASERPDDLSLWTVPRFVEELVAVRQSLGLDELHLLGSSWGGMLAMQYVLDRHPPLLSLTLCGSPASMPRWSRECGELLADLSAQTQQLIREHEENGYTDCPEYQAAILEFYRRHVCRMTPWPGGLERSFADVGIDVYHQMNGPSEFTVTGSLKDWDVTDQLDQIRVPTLLVGGEHDECRPAHLGDMAGRIPGSQHETIADASHLCFAEQPEAFGRVLRPFLSRAERSEA